MFEGSAEAAAKGQRSAMIEPEGCGLTLEACFQVYWTSPTPSQCRPVDPPPPEKKIIAEIILCIFKDGRELGPQQEKNIYYKCIFSF